RDFHVTGVQTCALPISSSPLSPRPSPSDARAPERRCRERNDMSAFEPRIAVEDLRKDYGPRRVLAGVDLEVLGGEVFALLGPNEIGRASCRERGEWSGG